MVLPGYEALNSCSIRFTSEVSKPSFSIPRDPTLAFVPDTKSIPSRAMMLRFDVVRFAEPMLTLLPLPPGKTTSHARSRGSLVLSKYFARSPVCSVTFRGWTSKSRRNEATYSFGTDRQIGFPQGDL